MFTSTWLPECAWCTTTCSGIAIALVMLTTNFLSDRLRDRLDPALRNNI
jgi:ABC-type dipeptide/oligopeptide/nickel transport system permease subunit